MSTLPAVEELDYGYSLVGSLRKDLRMLQGFPTVVQELIQNAEDAPESDTFWMDFTPEALRVGNSGEFEDEHFDRIIEIASGGKRHDPDSIGSFGVGFVSVYQVTDEPHIYSRRQVRILRPLDRKAFKQTGVEHEWPSTFVLPWATEDSVLRRDLEVEPVDLSQMATFITQARETFARSAVFLRKVKTLHLLQGGQSIETLTITAPAPGETVVAASSGVSTTYRMYDVPLSEEVQQEAARRKRRTTIQLALPLGAQDVKGLLYAFLPTRDETGLPLHINADFYPNTDRKGLLWDEADKRGWNERLLGCVVDFVPQLLQDLANHSPEALYTFADQVRLAASRASAAPPPVTKFVQSLWSACRLAFKNRPLFWSQTGDWAEHDAFLRVPHPISPLLDDALLRETYWHLPPEEHAPFRPLFRALEVQGLDGETFVDALEQLFGEGTDWLPAEERWPLLDAVFAYFDQLSEHQKGWPEKIPDLGERLNALALAIAENGELLVLAEAWRCPQEYLRVATPWLGKDVRVDQAWWDKAPSLLQACVQQYAPAHLAQHVKTTTNIPELVASGWPLSQAYTFLATDRQLGGQLLRQLPIYRTTAGEYCRGEDLAIPAQIEDRFHVRKLLDLDHFRGHEALLERLNLPPLDAATYYGKLLPEFFRQNLERRREVIEAIAQVYSRHDFPVGAWKPLPCAELTSGEWVRPEQAYWPDELLSSLFGQDYPVFAHEQYQGRGVRPLMEALDTRMSVSERDIVNELERRAQEPVTPENIETRQKVLLHALSAPTTVLSTHLSIISWLPDRERRGWHTPGTLLRAEDADLVGRHLGNKQVCGLTLSDIKDVRRENRSALGFAHPEPEQVTLHIKDLNANRTGPSSRILSWLNDRATRGRLPKPLCNVLRELMLFPLGEDRFAAATHLFREEPGLGRFRHRVGPKELKQLTSLLDALEVPRTPVPATFRDVLLEIARESVSGQTPPEEVIKVAERCIRALSDAFAKNPEDLREILQSLRGKRVVPVLWKERSKGSLLRPEDALLVDKPADELRKFNLPKHIDVRTRDVASHGFYEELGVRTMSAVWRVTYDIPAHSLRRLPEQDKKLRRMLPALLRLALKVHRRSSVGELQQRLLQYRFFRCDQIPARVELAGFRITGHCQLDYAVAAAAGHLYVRDLNPEHTVNVLAEILELRDPADRMALDTIWVKSLKEAQAYLTRFGWMELPEEYVPVEISSGTTTGAEDDFDEDFDDDDGVDEPSAPRTPRTGMNSTGEVGHSPQREGQAGQRGGKTASSPATTRPRDTSQPAGPRRPGTAPETASPRQPAPFSGRPETSQAPSGSTAAGHQQGGPRPAGESSSGSGQRSAASPSRQQRFRNYTYVYEGPEENEAETHAREVDRRGMKYVLSHERRRGHHPEDVSLDYGAGYDIRSADQDGVIRYIELKTMSGEWRERGVALSANQYAMAQRQKSQYWLYVIENLDGDPVLHEIQNPFERVTSYTFDDSWKQAPTAEEDVLLG